MPLLLGALLMVPDRVVVAVMVTLGEAIASLLGVVVPLLLLVLVWDGGAALLIGADGMVGVLLIVLLVMGEATRAENGVAVGLRLLDPPPRRLLLLLLLLPLLMLGDKVVAVVGVVVVDEDTGLLLLLLLLLLLELLAIKGVVVVKGREGGT